MTDDTLDTEMMLRSPYYTNRVVKCQIDRAMKEASFLRSMIGTGQLKEQDNEDNKSLLTKDRGFFYVRGRYISKSNYNGLTKEDVIKMEKEFVKDLEFEMLENATELDEDFVERIRME